MERKKKAIKKVDTAVLKKGQKSAEKNYILDTYLEGGKIYSLIHSDFANDYVTKDSKLLGHFEFENKKSYLEYKRAVGFMFKEIFDKEGVINDKNFSELLKKNHDEMKLKGWLNEFSLGNENKIKSSPQKNNFNAPSGKKEKVGQLKPVVVLMTLSDMGVIDVKDVVSNTTGEEFWKYTMNNSLGSHNDFKTSVKTKNFIINNPSSKKVDFFNDVYNSSKGYGVGSVGLISYLGAHGLFEDPLVGRGNEKQRYFRSLDYLYDKVLPNVPEELLVEKLEGQEQTVELDNYSRMPFKKKGQEGLIKDFLAFRGVSNDTIDRMIADEKVYGGFFSQNSFEKGHKLHFNQIFFNLLDENNDLAGAERFKITKNNDGTFDSMKFNTAKVSGNAHKIFGESPKITIFTEAIVDAWSEYEMIKKAGLNVENYNIFSVQGCGHLNNWFQRNIGFGFELDENRQDEFGRVFAVERKEYCNSLNDSEKEQYRKAFSDYSLNYVSLGTETDERNLQKIEVLKKELNVEFDVIEKKYRAEYINYNDFDKDKAVFMDNTNFNNFLKVNGISVENKEGQEELSLNKYNIRMEKSKLTDEKIKEIKNNMFKKLGSCSIALAFDNDEAGLKYAEVATYLSEDLNIKALDSTPEKIKAETDLNDVLKTVNEMETKNDHESAQEMIFRHINKIEPDLEMGYKKKVTLPPNKENLSRRMNRNA